MMPCVADQKYRMYILHTKSEELKEVNWRKIGSSFKIPLSSSYSLSRYIPYAMFHTIHFVGSAPTYLRPKGCGICSSSRTAIKNQLCYQERWIYAIWSATSLG